MRYADAMIVWNPDRSTVRVGLWPDKTGWSVGFRLKCGACFSEVREASPLRQRLDLMTAFNTLAVRDGIPVVDLHREFLKIEEYRSQIAPDQQGADV